MGHERAGRRLPGQLERRIRRRTPGLALLTALGAVLTGVAAAPVAQSAPRGSAGQLYVSESGNDQARCTAAHPCRTIERAVSIAHAGEEINVGPGTYHGQVSIGKRLTIQGRHAPIIDARGRPRGILIRGGRAAGSVVRGMVIQNATYEGILALDTRNVTIARNTVQHNDRGFFQSHRTGECTWNGQPPGAATVADLRAGGCGEGIHLASTSRSKVTGNTVTDNTGGIYLTDESGPAAHNLVSGNIVLANVHDCGITLASHSDRALSPSGRRRGSTAGVYDNRIVGNISNDNGVREPGAGILIAAAVPGSAAYGNTIIDNSLRGNGLPGIALHSHYGHEDLNDNVIVGNVVGRNAIGGSTGGPGDGDGGVKHTVGILVWSFQTRIVRLTVEGNTVSNDYFGIWTRHAPRVRRRDNHFHHVRVQVRQRR